MIITDLKKLEEHILSYMLGFKGFARTPRIYLLGLIILHSSERNYLNNIHVLLRDILDNVSIHDSRYYVGSVLF